MMFVDIIRLPSPNMYLRLGFVPKVPQQEQISIVRIAVGRVLLSQAHSIYTRSCRMPHNMEITKMELNLLVEFEYKLQLRKIFLFTLYIIYYLRSRQILRFALHRGSHHMTHNNQSILTE